MSYTLLILYAKILILSMEILPCTCSCEGTSLGVFPEGTILVPYNPHLDTEHLIYCVDETHKAQDLEFRLNYHQSVPSYEVNSTTIVLRINGTEKGIFSYYCQNKVTKRICITRVLVDSAPLPVTDFVCKFYNIEVLKCTWTNPNSPSVTIYSLTLTDDNGQSIHVCHPEKIGNTRYCSWDSWDSSFQPWYRRHKQLHVNLKFSNNFGSNEQNYTINPFSIVKLDPPINLKVIGNGTHSVYLQWSLPNTIVDYLPKPGLDHKIEYQIPKIDSTSYFRVVNTSELPPQNKTNKFLLEDLPYANMRYELRICIRPKVAVKDEYWSDFTYLVFYTVSERPNRPPDTVVGAFDQNHFETKRRIYVYWKQLEEYEEAGANFTYKVVAHQGTGNPRIMLANSKKSLSYVVLEDASLGAINIDIWSTNDHGSSLNKSHLFIPPYTNTVALRVTSFTKLAYENGTYELSWVGIDNIDNYTVFWCQQNTTKICSGRMNYTVLEPTKTNHVVDLPMENRYQFAISANNKTKTSGMIWASCDMSKDGIPMYGFPVKLDHGAVRKSSVKITWTMTCTLQEDTITGYLITYCPVKDTSNVCDPSIGQSIVYITDPKQMETNISDLKPYRTYQIYLSLNTKYGEKPIENASTRVTTTEDTPSSPRNVSISEVESNSIIISWDPPLETNGVIGKYVVYNYRKEYAVYKVPDNDMNSKNRRSLKLEGLHSFFNYSWSIAACNSAIRGCSQKSPPKGIIVKTRIGAPSKIKSLTFSRNSDYINWQKPEMPGGNINLYQILKVSNENKEIFNTTDSSFFLNNCQENFKYQVRAVNTESISSGHNSVQRLEYPGEWSDPITEICDIKEFPTALYIVGALAAVIVVIIVVYELIRFYKRKHSISILN